MKINKYGITTTKKIHSGWTEWTKLKETAPISTNTHPMGYFHKWHYLYKSELGEISLIKLLDYYRIGEHLWEIYCFDNDSPAKKELEDIHRFKDKSSAIKEIIRILRTDKIKKKDI